MIKKWFSVQNDLTKTVWHGKVSVAKKCAKMVYFLEKRVSHSFPSFFSVENQTQTWKKNVLWNKICDLTNFLFGRKRWKASYRSSNERGCFYCKLVKVRTFCILCNNWCLFRLWSLTPDWFGVAFIHSVGRVSLPNKIDRLYIPNRDRQSLVIESIITIFWHWIKFEILFSHFFIHFFFTFGSLDPRFLKKAVFYYPKICCLFFLSIYVLLVRFYLTVCPKYMLRYNLPGTLNQAQKVVSENIRNIWQLLHRVFINFPNVMFSILVYIFLHVFSSENFCFINNWIDPVSPWSM